MSRTGGRHDRRIDDAVWSLDVGCPGGGGTSRFIVTFRKHRRLRQYQRLKEYTRLRKHHRALHRHMCEGLLVT